MIIETLKHQYYVIHKKESVGSYELFQCTELKEKRYEYYDVFRVTDAGLIYRLIPEYAGPELLTSFEDFYECFSRNGELYLVFVSRRGRRLAQVLREEYNSLEERLLLGKKLLERILLLSMPEAMLHQVLREENLEVGEDLEIRFRYSLKKYPLNTDELHGRNIQSLGGIFEQLFETELRLKKSAVLQEFIRWLYQAVREEYLAVYRRYEELCGTLKDGGTLPGLRPNTLGFRVWNRIKAVLPVLKKVLLAVLLAAMASYLLYSVLYPGQPETSPAFQQIGTLEIQG